METAGVLFLCLAQKVVAMVGNRAQRGRGLLIVIALAAAGCGSGAAQPGAFSGNLTTTDVIARERVSPLAAIASFGWLPPGFSVSAATRRGMANWTTTQSIFLNAAAPTTGGVLALNVYTAGSCRLTGPQQAAAPGQDLAPSLPVHQHLTRYPHGLRCYEGAGAGSDLLLLTGNAPPVRGDPAYWTTGGGLAWEHARGAWAWLNPTVPDTSSQPTISKPTVSRPLLERVAAHVRYRVTPLAFPFRVTGVPRGWQVVQGSVAESEGRLVGAGLALGPADDPFALDLGVSLPGDQSPCSLVAQHWRYVRLDGVRGYLVTLNGLPFKYLQFLCAANVRGLQLDLNINRIVPGTRGTLVPGIRALGGLLAVFGRMTLLGPDPAHWTTHPLGN